MRAFLIVCVCLGALAAGAFFAYYASSHPQEVAQALNAGRSAYGVVQSLPVKSILPGAATQNGGWTPPAVIPAHDDWTWNMGDGKVFNNVVITNMTANQVTVTHSEGVAHLPYSELPPDVLAELHYPSVSQPATNSAGQGH